MVNKLYSEKNNNRELMLYSYKAGKFYTNSYYLQQGRFALNQLLGRQRGGATIRVSMPMKRRFGRDPSPRETEMWGLLTNRPGRNAKAKEQSTIPIKSAAPTAKVPYRAPRVRRIHTKAARKVDANTTRSSASDSSSSGPR